MSKLAPHRPTKFIDKKSYKKRLEEAKAKQAKHHLLLWNCKIGGLMQNLLYLTSLLWGEVWVLLKERR